MTCSAQLFKKTYPSKFIKIVEHYFPNHATEKVMDVHLQLMLLMLTCQKTKRRKMQNSNEKKKQPSASNTALLLNIFEILAEMPFIDAIDDDGQTKSTKQSKTKFHHHHSSVKGPHRQFVSWRILFLFLCYKCKILFTRKYKINQCNKSVQHSDCVSFRT